jgi:DNA-binding winged helix-turn-helix (wHTH) protein
MVAVILVSSGSAPDGLESLLKEAGWAPHRLSKGDRDGGLGAQLKGALAAPSEGNPVHHTAFILAVDLVEAHRAVEQTLGECSRVRIVLVAPDSVDREGRRALVRALRAGADDFVAASAVERELVLRLSGRGRARRRELSRLQRICGLQLERGARRLRHGDKVVSLTPCEYRVFSCLAGRPGHAVSRATIQRDLARRSRSVSKNMVDVYVLYLRRKLAKLECSCSIRTVRGVGYALSEEQMMGAARYDPTTGSVVTSHLDD